jgi:hypothetical protein
MSEDQPFDMLHETTPDEYTHRIVPVLVNTRVYISFARNPPQQSRTDNVDVRGSASHI